MITAAQIRAARAFLDWSQSDLARETGVARRTIISLETETAATTPETMEKLIAVFKANGVRFVSEGRELGVMVRPRRKPARAHSQGD